MEQLTHIIAKYSPEPGFLLLIIFLFSFGKSVIFISSLLPPASITLMLGIVAGKRVLPDGYVWGAITLGAMFGSVLSFHCGALFCRQGALERLPVRLPAPLHRAKRPCRKKAGTVIYFAFFGGDALQRAVGRRHHCAASEAGVLRQRAVRRDLGAGPDIG